MSATAWLSLGIALAAWVLLCELSDRAARRRDRAEMRKAAERWSA
jgi:hypothetical protein